MIIINLMKFINPHTKSKALLSFKLQLKGSFPADQLNATLSHAAGIIRILIKLSSAPFWSYQCKN